jgi:DNA-directed RNA polymerase specialized sigma24 family protein
MNQPYYYIEGLIAKDRKILEEFYEETRLSVFTMAYLILDDASATKLIMKDIFHELVQKAATYALGTSFSKWILGITSEVATSKYWEMVKKDTGPKEKDDLTRKLDEYLGSLGHEARFVYLLHDVAGIPLKEVSKHVHAPLVTLLLLENKAERISERNSLRLGNKKDSAAAELEKIILKYIPANVPDIDLSGIETKEANATGNNANLRLLRQVIWTGIMIILFIILIIVIIKA